MTLEQRAYPESWDYDRERLRDAINLLRAVGCVLSGAAFLIREVRQLPPIRRPHKKRSPKFSGRSRFWNLAIPGVNNISLRQTTLYRPVGPEELALIAASGYREFPPRLPDQPIFYPVINEEYATQIARDWNVKACGSGYVTRFSVRSNFLAPYRVEAVGPSVHQEYWIPAAELPGFNSAIVGPIEVIAEFHDERATLTDSAVPEQF